MPLQNLIPQRHFAVFLRIALVLSPVEYGSDSDNGGAGVDGKRDIIRNQDIIDSPKGEIGYDIQLDGRPLFCAEANNCIKDGGNDRKQSHNAAVINGKAYDADAGDKDDTQS